MKNQLNELVHNRELDNQPYLSLYDVKASIEKPKFYCSPPKEYKVIPRFHIYYSVKNIGNYPAISIDISCQIKVDNKNQPLYSSTVSNRIDSLEEKCLNGNDFQFSNNANAILESLIEDSYTKFPVLEFSILYRNILGGCFLIETSYYLYPQNKAFIKKWLLYIKSYPIIFLNELAVLERISIDDQQHDSLFNGIKDKVKNDLNEDPDEIDLAPVLIPGSLIVKEIAKNQYIELIKEISYPKVLSIKQR
jgi:hypothetical protein